MIGLRCDLSTAEHRITAMLTHDPELMRQARTPPWEFDAYRDFAAFAFSKPADQVSKLERQACKTVVLGTDYSMQPERMSNSLLKHGLLFSEQECAALQNKYLQRYPSIRDSYHYRCRMKCIQTRQLTNAWGRRIYFAHERFGPELYRRLYAWTPQSNCGDLLNQYGFVVAHQFIEKYGLKSRINLQVHDELFISTNVAEGWDIMRLLQESLTRPVLYEGEPMSMPVAYCVETRYHLGDFGEWKRFPTYDEYVETASKCWEARVK